MNKGKTAGIVTDFSGDVDIDGYTSSKTTVRKGQSFISEDGKKWEDVTKYKDGDNIRLKAITEKGRIAPKSLSAETVRIENGK